MRIFFYKCIKSISYLYFCTVLALSFRLVYNEYYEVFHEEVLTGSLEGEWVYPLGQIVGIYTKCEGIFVIDTCEIETKDSEFISPASEVLKEGDYLLQVNGVELTEKEILVKEVEKSNGNPIELSVLRGEEVISINITPILGKNGKYMLGVWVKDDLAGVGTITYYEEDGDFAALGHGMGDGVTKGLLSVSGGDIYVSNIVGIEKGKRGTPGEVKGVIYYGTSNHIGMLDTNCNEGIFGTLDEDDFKRYCNQNELCQIGKKHEIEIGKAKIISDISGERKTYDIEISYVDYLAVNSNKGLHIEIVDTELLELTGGIVQGMSGSPIIQNGKLVGAVTHVLINDPTKGYGIFIENMLEH